MNKIVTRKGTVVQDPGIAQLLFSDTRMAWLWTILRVYVGWQWLNSGWGKFNNPAWINTGESLKNYWVNAVKVDPRPVIYFDWYRDFISFMLSGGHYVWFSKLVLFGEIAIGIALILGAFTGIAAFGGGFMNWNFMMAGTASSNPVLLLLSVFILMAWKVAGYYGADRWLLPLLGTPWPTAPVEVASMTPTRAALKT